MGNVSTKHDLVRCLVNNNQLLPSFQILKRVKFLRSKFFCHYLDSTTFQIKPTKIYLHFIFPNCDFFCFIEMGLEPISEAWFPRCWWHSSPWVTIFDCFGFIAQSSSSPHSHLLRTFSVKHLVFYKEDAVHSTGPQTTPLCSVTIIWMYIASLKNISMYIQAMRYNEKKNTKVMWIKNIMKALMLIWYRTQIKNYVANI